VNAFNVIVMRAFFMGLAGRDPGVRPHRRRERVAAVRRIVLPLSKAVLSVIGLFYAVGYWNAFFNALLYINDNSRWPLQLILRTYVVSNHELGVSRSRERGPAAPAVTADGDPGHSVVPILLVYPFLQRHFTRAYSPAPSRADHTPLSRSTR